jgi:multiple sugar transport system permease protein
VRLRAAQFEDCPALAQIQVDSYQTAYAGILLQSYLDHFSYAEETADWQRWLSSNHDEILYVAETDAGMVVGYALADIVCELAIGLGLALLLNREFRGRTWLRLAILIPMMIPPLASGLMWRYMYDHTFGIIAYLVRLLGVEPPVFLADAQLTLYALVATEVWRASPFMVLVILAALQSVTIWMLRSFFEEVPRELEEAAWIDGATRLQTFVQVVGPLAVPGLAATAVFVAVGAWNAFLYAVLLGGVETRTLPVFLASHVMNRDLLWGRVMATGVLVVVPPILFAMLVQRNLVKGLTLGALKG